MSNSRSRSASLHEEEELRLPRPPGVIRRFWGRHPLIADVLIASVCFILSIAPTSMLSRPIPGSGFTISESALVFVSVAISVVVVIACILTVRRRKWPIVTFIAAHAVAVSYLFVSAPVGGPLVLVAGYTLAVHRSSRAAWIGLAIGMGSLTAVTLFLHSVGVISVNVALNAVVGELALGLIGTLIGVNVGGRKRYLEALIDRSRQLLVERDQREQLAAGAERARIAREMHDIVSHSLTVIVALSEGAAATRDQTRARDAATAAAATARDALTEMRAMLGVLRDGDTDLPLAPTEPVPPHTTVATAQRAGYPVTLTITGDATLPAATEYAVGRIVQEGMTNAMRHAPRATEITVRIDYSGDPLVIEIENDGVTGPVGAAGFGLRGLLERAAHANGDLRSGPTGEGRWELRAELPAGTDVVAAIPPPIEEER